MEREASEGCHCQRPWPGEQASPATRAAFKRWGWDASYLGDLIQYEAHELARKFRLSPAVIAEIKELLATRGLTLGAKLENWPPAGLDRRSERAHGPGSSTKRAAESWRPPLPARKGERLYLGDLVQYRPSQLAREFGFSLAQICEIEALLLTRGLRLGTRLGNWPPAGLDRTPRAAQRAGLSPDPRMDRNPRTESMPRR